MKLIKKHFTMIILIFIFILGLCLLLYPSVSDWWSSMHQSRVIANYQETVDEIDDSEYEAMLEAAEAYNKALTGRDDDRFEMTDEEMEEYESLLDLTGTGVMGYIKIDKIGVELPIYHGIDENALQIAAGHLPGTSLPVGGESTHSVICGHRGLPSATLFTDLDQLEVGDSFEIHILKETFTYEVDQILIVEPEDVSALAIEEGADLCTLLTCTPYGVNTQRLLVRGHRVENASVTEDLTTADAMTVDPMLVALFIAVPVLVILLVVLLVSTRRKSQKGGKDD